MKFDTTTIDADFFASLKNETHFYLIRHGESEGNVAGIIQGHLDLPLTDNGRNQAKKIGKWCQNKHISSIFSSPLIRAHETASIIANEINIPEITNNEMFKELDAGTFSGFSMEQISKQFPKEHDDFHLQSWAAVSSAEQSHEIYNRAIRAWNLLLNKSKEGHSKILLVTHGMFIQWMVKVTFGCKTWLPYLSTGNCAVFELVISPHPELLGVSLKWKHLNYIPSSLI